MRRARPAGFTLLEVLVVLFVVAVMAGIAVMQLGSRDRDRALETEARRLQHALELTRQEAVLTADEWGLETTADGYRFLRLNFEDGRWEALSSRPWREHRLKDDIALKLRIEDRRRGPSALAGSDRERRPDLLILSSGEVTPFRIELEPAWPGPTWVLESDGFGAIKAERGST